jgi:hypothetical protein
MYDIKTNQMLPSKAKPIKLLNVSLANSISPSDTFTTLPHMKNPIRTRLTQLKISNVSLVSTNKAIQKVNLFLYVISGQQR